ncbi:MAG TPA: SDR family NAD(P)-dependent oxidoreductase [Micromonosporaceae bacterium]|jgi:daunorubicin C-13 ketoreductase
MGDWSNRPRVAVVTGASSGIGLAAAIELGRRGWYVGLLGRDQGRLAAALERVHAVASLPPRSFRCDFGSLAEVRSVAAQVREAYPSIDVLANNAGGNVAARRWSRDGFEETIQVNHLAPFLLSHLLRESLRGGRIVNTSSRVHARGRLDPDDLNRAARRFASLRVYADTKQANVLFTIEATRRWPDILSVAFHPGIVRTRFGRENAIYRIFWQYAPGLRTPEQGAHTLVYLATAPRASLCPGGYYLDERQRTAGARAGQPQLAERLWEASVKAVGA